MSWRWKEAPILVIDTETTGLSPTDDRIIEVAWVSYCNGVVLSEGDFFLNPDRKLSDFIVQLTGIHDSDLVGASHFRDKVSSLEGLIAFHPILAGYNGIGFDRHFLTAEMARAGAVSLISTMYERPWLDPLIWAREFQKFQKGKKLTDVAARLGITSPDPPHRALSDTRLTARIMAFYLAGMPSTIENMLDTQNRWDQEHNSHYAEWRSKREEVSEET